MRKWDGEGRKWDGEGGGRKNGIVKGGGGGKDKDVGW